MKKLSFLLMPLFLLACNALNPVDPTAGAQAPRPPRSLPDTWTPAPSATPQPSSAPGNTTTPSAVPSATETPQRTHSPTPSAEASPPRKPMPTPPAAPTLTLPPQYNIHSIHMIDAQNGWAISTDSQLDPRQETRSWLMHTSDGGHTWVDVTPPNMPYSLDRLSFYPPNIFFLDAQSAWVGGDNLLHSIDGGKTWKEISSSSPLGGRISFANEMDGWAKVFYCEGKCMLARYETHDGGATWKQMVLGELDGGGVDLELHTRSVDYFYYNPAQGPSWPIITPNYVLRDYQGWGSVAILMEDMKWKDVELPSAADLFTNTLDIPGIVSSLPVFLNEKIGFLQIDTFPDEDKKSYTYLYGTHDGGLSWSLKPILLEHSTSIDFVSPQVAFMTCESNLCVTHDGAHTLQTLTPNLDFEQVEWFDFVSSTKGWAKLTDDDSNTLWETQDGGQTWSAFEPAFLPGQSVMLPTESPTPTPTATPVPPFEIGQAVTLANLHMLDASNGWALEASGHIVRTTDGGQTWQDVTPTEAPDRTWAFFALDANTAWATPHREDGDKNQATVWRTSDGGRSWQPSQPILLDIIYENSNTQAPRFRYRPVTLQFIDATSGWLIVDINDGGMLLFHTSDGAATWDFTMKHFDILKDTNRWCSVATGLAFADTQTGWISRNCVDQTFNRLTVGGLENGWWGFRQTGDGGYSWEDTFDSRLPTSQEFQQAALPPTAPIECGETRLVSIAPGIVGVEWFCRFYAKPQRDYGFFSLTSDSGQTWHTWESSGGEEFFDANTGWRLFFPNEDEPGRYQKTPDGGRTWTTLKTVAWQTAQFDFVSEQVGWVIVTHDGVSALIHTIDGGLTWQEIKPVAAE